MKLEKLTVTRLAVVAGILCCVTSANAQMYPGPQPSENERQDAGRRSACNAYTNQYNVYVNFHNAAKTNQERMQWRQKLNYTKQQISQYCR